MSAVRDPSRRWLLRAGVALLLLVVASVAYVTDTLIDAGQFKDLELKVPPNARVIEGFSGGTEDAVFRKNGRELFVSAPNFNDPSKPGGIFLVDVESGTIRNVTPEAWLAPGELQPHGIDLWTDDDSERLFVVNHPGGSGLPDAAGQSGNDAVHAVEIFDVAEDGSLTHVDTVSHELMLSPNDVAAVGADSFYLTNDHGHPGGFMRTVEDYARLAVGNVLFVDERREVRVAWSGTRYANGINSSADGRSLYLAETTRRSVTWLERDPATNELTFVSRHDTGTGVDNIDVAEDGSLWIGAHPKMLTFVEHSHAPRTARSPSEVLRLVPAKGRWEQTTVYLNDGDPLSGSSIAASNGSVVVIGAVFDARLIVLPAS